VSIADMKAPSVPSSEYEEEVEDVGREQVPAAKGGKM
jgi:hypothetical protein